MLALLIFISLMMGSQAQAASDQSVADHWRALTTKDVEASYNLLRNNHPGAVPELRDTKFQQALESGYKLALQRARRVENFDGYAATLAGFSQAFGDKHIWSRLNYSPNALKWAGLLVAKRGSRWIVVDTEADEAGVKGFDLVSCDGKPVEELGRERIGGFRAFWEIEAQRVQQAPWLLIDNGNPFIGSPKSCRFVDKATTLDLRLKWREVSRTDLVPRMIAAVGIGQAGYGVRAFDGGSWISLQGLGSKAPAVIEEVRRRIAEIGKSRMVVIDLRGNGGGNSEYGRQLAEILLGRPYLDSIFKQMGGQGCVTAWRVSPDNIKTLEEYKVRFGPTLGADYEREQTALIASAKKAFNEGKSFSGPISCAAAALDETSAQRPRWPVPYKLVLLTDVACFSSCLMVTDDFRRLGAIHVGQTTDAATHYMEVREIKLPSGLSHFSTLQSFAPDTPPMLGPFVPEHIYDGDIANTVDVERWIIEKLAG